MPRAPGLHSTYNLQMPDLIEQADRQTVISVTELNRLARAAIERGVPLVWVVDPANQKVTVYRSLQDIKILSADQELDGGQVISGFRTKIADIFAL